MHLASFPDQNGRQRGKKENNTDWDAIQTRPYRAADHCQDSSGAFSICHHHHPLPASQREPTLSNAAPLSGRIDPWLPADCPTLCSVSNTRYPHLGAISFQSLSSCFSPFDLFFPPSWRSLSQSSSSRRLLNPF